MLNLLMLLNDNLSQIPNVTGEQLSSKIVNMIMAVYNMINGWFYNLAVLILVIGIIVFIIALIFHQKTAMKVLLGICGVALGIVIFANIFNIVGFFKTIANM